MDLKVVVESRGEYTVLCVTGDVDVYTAPGLRQGLVDLVSKGRTRIIVDLSGVEFMDSTGLGVLVGALRRIREASGELLLAGVRPNVRRVLDITGLSKAFDIPPPSPPPASLSSPSPSPDDASGPAD